MRHIALAAVVFLFLNALMLTAGVGWLAMTGRLSAERAREVVAVFTDPVAVTEQLEAERQREAQADAEAARYSALPTAEPIDAPGAIQQRLEGFERERLDLERREREAHDILRQAGEKLELLTQEEARLAAERDAFHAERDRISEISGSEQFTKALAALKSMDPEMASTLLKRGWDRGERRETIAYLDALPERSRGAILTVLLESGDEDMAADLLTGLRTFGIAAAQQGAADESQR